MHKIPHDEFERFLRRNLLRAIALGYSPEEVIDSIRVITARGFDVAHAEAPVEVTAATHASHQGWTHDTAPVIAITECSIEQSEDLARDLERHLRVSAVPVVLEVLRKDPAELIKFLGPRTLYVTTPFHQVEVVEVLRKHRLEPFILDLALSREFLATLKRLERYRAVGVLCRDEESLAAASGLVRSYLRRGDGVTLIEALVDDVEAMSRLNRDAEIVIHAPNCRMEAQTLLPWGIEKVETTFEIDTDSLAQLRRLVESKQESIAVR